MLAVKYTSVAVVIPVVSVYTVVVALSAAVIGLLAVWLYRQYSVNSGSELSEDDKDPDLIRPFLLMLVVFVASALGYAFVTVTGPSELGLGLATVVLASVPWTIFALRYTGRGYLVTRFRIGLFTPLVLIIAVLMAIPVMTERSPDILPQSVRLAVAFAQLGIVGVVFVMVGFILVATYRHESLALASGAVVAIPIGIFLIVSQVTRPSVPVFSTTLLTSSYVILAVTLVLSVTRYDVLSVRPGTSIIGERLIVDKMDEAVFVVDRGGDIARTNETAEQMFGADVKGKQFADVLGCPASGLSETSTIERWTEDGRMRFDPRISELTNSQGRTLGNAVTLLNVTQREIRRQRIEVLNRILRHNLRNNIDVIKANAEVAANQGQTADEHIRTIVDATENLEGLSIDARRIETVIADSGTATTAVDLRRTIESVVDTVMDKRSEQATVTIEVSPVTIRTNTGLLNFALENIVENAVEHNDSPDPQVEIQSSVTGTCVQIRVEDNGPGIPESERAVLATGREDSLTHAKSLGLWGIKWAVETLGGDLSFGDSELGGAAVCIEIPQSEPENV